MKRIWFGVVLLILMLVLGLISSTFMKETWLKQSENLNRAAILASDGDWVNARNLLAEAQAEWEEKQLLLAVLCQHEPIEQIDGLFAQLEVFSESRKGASFESTCVYLARQLESLGRSHSFNFSNFL